MLGFADVLVTPFTDLMHTSLGRSDHRGGPHWPDFGSQTDARHRRWGSPIDVEPEPWEGEQPIEIETPVAWAGPTMHHFGHQVAEFSMRLIPTVSEWPDAEFLFGFHPRGSIHSVTFSPAYFLQLLDWCGIARERAHLHRGPVLARELLVAPQAEQIGVGPNAAHLDLLDDWTEQRLGHPPRSGTVFVSRAATLRPVAGEDYLEDVLRAVGVTVIRPETMSLEEQLRTYASADLLIFTEGSALHGAQLMGRALGDVVVLNRRRGLAIARASIAPRARSLTYAEVTGSMVMGLTLDGSEAPWLGVAILDEGLLLAELDRLDIPARAAWDSLRFMAARDAAVVTWLTAESATDRGAVPGFGDKVRETMAAAGLSDLAPSSGA